MPYSLQRQLEHKKKMWIKRNTALFANAAKEAASRALEEVCEEGSKIFDQCIDQFYMYKTRSYYRHEAGKGTGTGWNLYLANGFRKSYKNGYVTSFTSGWDSRDMLPYGSVTAEYVLNNVMNGIRGLEDKYMRFSFGEYDNHWAASISSPLFGELNGTPEQIFQIFDNEWRSVAITLNQRYRKEAFSKIKMR